MTDESKTTGHDPNGHDPNGHGPDGRAPDGHGPDEYRVYLSQVFSGPLDLLLHLVKEQEVEISEVKISEVVDGYLEYVKDLEELDLELAGEFLVLAATLMSIKSRSLWVRSSLNGCWMKPRRTRWRHEERLDGCRGG
ncbi:MAG: segregation/condensation protein A, partial [Planctomycetota bacterium]|nr:segregation/condensation protein A [Planctomycetota bacterium]